MPPREPAKPRLTVKRAQLLLIYSFAVMMVVFCITIFGGFFQQYALGTPIASKLAWACGVSFMTTLGCFALVWHCHSREQRYEQLTLGKCCPNCRYPLEMQPEDVTCPECGRTYWTADGRFHWYGNTFRENPKEPRQP